VPADVSDTATEVSDRVSDRWTALDESPSMAIALDGSPSRVSDPVSVPQARTADLSDTQAPGGKSPTTQHQRAHEPRDN
jgi:hypothetical protein